MCVCVCVLYVQHKEIWGISHHAPAPLTGSSELQTWRNPDVGKDLQLLRPPCQQHSLSGCLQDNGHTHIYSTLLNDQWDGSCLSSRQVFDGTEGGPLGDKIHVSVI